MKPLLNLNATDMPASTPEPAVQASDAPGRPSGRKASAYAQISGVAATRSFEVASNSDRMAPLMKASRTPLPRMAAANESSPGMQLRAISHTGGMAVACMSAMTTPAVAPLTPATASL